MDDREVLEEVKRRYSARKMEALWEFLTGLALTGTGSFLLADIIVTNGFWSIFGYSTFGLILIPIFIGVTELFVNRHSVWGRLLAGGGLIIILVGVFAEIHVFFKPTSLFNTLLMIILLAAGMGLIIRSYDIKSRI